MYEVLTVVRYGVLALFGLAAVAAAGSWLVRTRRISPFSPLGRALRWASDPLLRPVERALVRGGGNPAHAAGWLIVLVAVAGILLITGLETGTRWAFQLEDAVRSGPVAIFVLLVNVAYTVLFIALIARVVGTWFGLFRYARWMRLAYTLTDWLVEPIRRLLPPTGMLDFSPLVAWLVLILLRLFLLRVVL
ncbi:MAG TPA: YggT family protein [Gemmatimonadales bacterium]|nr:YggT family protein [Gemmatimonadales bacterium]